MYPLDATPRPPRPPAYATISEATDYTRLSPRTLRRAVVAGRLRCHRAGGRCLYAYEDLDRFIRGDVAPAP